MSLCSAPAIYSGCIDKTHAAISHAFEISSFWNLKTQRTNRKNATAKVLAYSDTTVDGVAYYTIEYQSSSSRGDKHFISKVPPPALIIKRGCSETRNSLPTSPATLSRYLCWSYSLGSQRQWRAQLTDRTHEYFFFHFCLRQVAIVSKKLYVLTALAKVDKFADEEAALRAAVDSFLVAGAGGSSQWFHCRWLV